MKLSTKGRYGTRAMVQLALAYGKGPVSLRDISKKEDISERYLVTIMGKLTSRGLVKSLRGQNGGFTLARPPELIHMSEVVAVLEGSIAPAECVDNPAICKRCAVCVTHDVWQKMNEAMITALDAITMQDMVEMFEQKCNGTAQHSMYYI